MLQLQFIRTIDSAATWRMRLKFDNANFGENQTYNHSRSSKIIDPGANRKRKKCNFLLVDR